MTWAEIKNAALKLMFSYSVKGTENATTNNFIEDYTDAMPEAANRAIRDLAFVCPIRDDITLSQYKETNLAVYAADTDTGVITLTAEDARSFYCEIDGDCTIYYEHIQEDDSVIVDATAAVTRLGFYQVKRYVYSSKCNVRIRIVGDLDNIRLRNYGLYVRYYALWEVPSPSDWQTYSLSEIITRQTAKTFMKIAEKAVRLNNDEAGYNDYDISGICNYDGKDTLRIPTSFEGEIMVYYFAYPTAITSATLDAFEIELDNEAADLVPLYIASQLYLEDDAKIAAKYEQEYISKRNALDPKGRAFGFERMTSLSGW